MSSAAMFGVFTDGALSIAALNARLGVLRSPG